MARRVWVGAIVAEVRIERKWEERNEVKDMKMMKSC